MTQRTIILLGIFIALTMGAGCSQQDYSDPGASPSPGTKAITASPVSGKDEPRADPVKVTPFQGVPPRAPD